MCGFAGIFDKLGTGSFENKINCMTKALSHRGPDEQKTWINKKEGPVAFLLWGAKAKSVLPLLTNPDHLILMSPNNNLFLKSIQKP